MEARMANPAYLVPDAMGPLQALAAATRTGGVPTSTLAFVHLRASQINGCELCIDLASRELKETAESDERLLSVARWRDADCFTDSERAALALSEAMTRLSDDGEGVSDDVWDEAARHYTEAELAALVLSIATGNLWNRINVATRQPVGAAW